MGAWARARAGIIDASFAWWELLDGFERGRSRGSGRTLREESAAMKVKAKVDGKVVAQAEETFVFTAVPLEGKVRAEVEAIERDYLKQLWAGMPKED